MSAKSCTHIKVTGVRCGSPALRGEQFCYFHQRMLRTVRFPSSRVLRSALLEDPESIQASLMEVVNGLLRGTLELKRGELILRALNTAVRNIRHARFDLHQEDMIREIPHYPDPPIEQVDEQAARRRPPTHEEVARQRAASLAEYFGGYDKIPERLKPRTPAAMPAPIPSRVATDAFVRPPSVGNNGTDHAGKDSVARDVVGKDVIGKDHVVKNNVRKDHVGTAAPGCPGGPAVPGRSAAPQNSRSTEPAAIAQSALAQKPPRSALPAVNRKPPASVKETPASARVQAQSPARKEVPKERKIAAHRASGG